MISNKVTLFGGPSNGVSYIDNGGTRIIVPLYAAANERRKLAVYVRSKDVPGVFNFERERYARWSELTKTERAAYLLDYDGDGER